MNASDMTPAPPHAEVEQTSDKESNNGRGSQTQCITHDIFVLSGKDNTQENSPSHTSGL